MDPETQHKALELLKVHSEALSPLYSELEAQLLGGVASDRLVDRQEELAHLQANSRLITEVTRLLPSSYDKTPWELHAENLFQAVLLTSHVVFIDHLGTDLHGTAPTFAYVVGQRPIEPHSRKEAKSPRTQLLLQPFGQPEKGYAHDSLGHAYGRYSHSLKIATVTKKFMDDRQARINSDMARDYSQEDLDAVFSEKAGGIVLSTPGWPRPGEKGEHTLNITDLSGRNIGIHTIGGGGISDTDMATFGVIKHLNELAVAFGVQDAAQNLFENYSARSDSDDVAMS